MIMDYSIPTIPVTAPYMGYGAWFWGWYGAWYGTNNCVEWLINNLSDTVNANGVREAVNSVGNNVVGWTASVKDTVNWVNQNVTSGNYTTLTWLNDLGRDITNSISRAEVSSLNAVAENSRDNASQFNSSNIATMSWFNNTNRTIDIWFNQSFLQSKDLMAQMASCCCDIKTEMAKQHCDIKQLVSAENSQTRDLITSNRILELERKLNDVKSENSNLNQSQYLLNQLQTCCPKTCSTWNWNWNWN